MKRRVFLGQTSTFLSALLLASCASGVQLPQNNYPAGSKGKIFLALAPTHETAILRILNLDDDSYIDFPVKVKSPHSIVRSALSADEVFLIGFSKTAASINIRTGKIVYFFNSPDARFSGHGLCTPEGQIWTTETFDGGQYARARSASDLSIDPDHKIVSGHHLIRLPGTSTLVTGGAYPAEQRHFLKFYDYKTRTTIQEFSIEYTPVHVLPLSPTEVIAVTTNPVQNTKKDNPDALKIYGREFDMSAPTPVMYFNVNGEVRTLWDVKQKDLFQYGLGITKGPGSSFVTAHTHSNTVIHWDGFQMKNVIRVKGPIAVTCPGDKSQVVALCPYQLKIFSLETSQLVRTVKYPENIVAFSSY